MFSPSDSLNSQVGCPTLYTRKHETESFAVEGWGEYTPTSETPSSIPFYTSAPLVLISLGLWEWPTMAHSTQASAEYVSWSGNRRQERGVQNKETGKGWIRQSLRGPTLGPPSLHSSKRGPWASAPGRRSVCSLGKAQMQHVHLLGLGEAGQRNPRSGWRRFSGQKHPRLMGAPCLDPATVNKPV